MKGLSVLLTGLLLSGCATMLAGSPSSACNENQATRVKDHKDAEYVIEGKHVKLEAGCSEIESAPGAASRVITKYFGNEVRLDLDGDGREDVVFLLTQETGGSGIFYYVVAALNTRNGYIGSAAVFLGDRIAPQTTQRGKGRVVVVNYADRRPGESFAERPSVGKSIWLLLDPATLQFGEVARDFEGEADPSKMTLQMKTWTWISAIKNDGTEVKPLKTEAFTLTFSNDGSFSATSDCNRIGGKYAATDGKLSFGDMFATRMYCEGSQESAFTRMLGNAHSYRFTSRGELVLELKFDSGSVVFR
jgi:heat shock protein HslJ